MGKASWKTHGQHGILYGINGKSRCHRYSWRKLWSSWGRICALRVGTSTRENQRGCGIYPHKWNLSTTPKFIFKYIASFNKPYTTRFARYGSNRQKLTQTSALGFD